jgi:hypothetical protein
MTQEDATPKIQIDSDWKAQVQAEKEALAEKEAESPDPQTGQSKPGHGGLPEASFSTLVGMLASQAIMGLGAVQDKETGGVVIDLEGAKLSIDLLEVLQQKTKGNLTDQESTEITQLLAELRARFVQITQLLAQQAQAGHAPGVGPASGNPAGSILTDPTT